MYQYILRQNWNVYVVFMRSLKVIRGEDYKVKQSSNIREKSSQCQLRHYLKHCSSWPSTVCVQHWPKWLDDISCPRNSEACGWRLVEWQPILLEKIGVIADYFVARRCKHLAHLIDAHLSWDPVSFTASTFMFWTLRKSGPARDVWGQALMTTWGRRVLSRHRTPVKLPCIWERSGLRSWGIAPHILTLPPPNQATSLRSCRRWYTRTSPWNK